MFKPGECANPNGNRKNSATEMLRAALIAAGKGRHTNPFDRIAELFYSSSKMALAILPYIAPRLRTLEVSGEVQVPFKFIIEGSDGKRVPLPKQTKQVASNVMSLPVLNSSKPQVVATTNKRAPVRVPKAKSKQAKARSGNKDRTHAKTNK